ncbi:MAG TPA: hypothetical protein VNT04_10005 [Gaiellaceae bacterium]|jgi:hypothetical protein|nr:hypothetical protein [Gaiellaceae bacterium]
MLPRAEFVHWWFATGFLVIGVLLVAEAVVGTEVWRRRPWRAYLWPGFMFLMGVLMWPVMVFYTNSTIHMLAHGSWAQAMMLAGGAELALVRGKIRSPYWRLATALGLAVSGAAILIHEQNGWLFARAAFLHHAIGWTAMVGAGLLLLRAFRPRSTALQAGVAVVFVLIAVFLYSDRDTAPIFGHMSPLAGEPRR